MANPRIPTALQPRYSPQMSKPKTLGRESSDVQVQYQELTPEQLEQQKQYEEQKKAYEQEQENFNKQEQILKEAIAQKQAQYRSEGGVGLDAEIRGLSQELATLQNLRSQGYAYSQSVGYASQIGGATSSAYGASIKTKSPEPSKVVYVKPDDWKNLNLVKGQVYATSNDKGGTTYFQYQGEGKGMKTVQAPNQVSYTPASQFQTPVSISGDVQKDIDTLVKQGYTPFEAGKIVGAEVAKRQGIEITPQTQEQVRSQFYSPTYSDKVNLAMKNVLNKFEEYESQPLYVQRGLFGTPVISAESKTIWNLDKGTATSGSIKISDIKSTRTSAQIEKIYEDATELENQIKNYDKLIIKQSDGTQVFTGTQEELNEYNNLVSQYENKFRQVEELRGSAKFGGGVRDLFLGFLPETRFERQKTTGILVGGALTLGLGLVPAAATAFPSVAEYLVNNPSMIAMDVVQTGQAAQVALNKEYLPEERIKGGIFTGLGIYGGVSYLRGVSAGYDISNLAQAETRFVAQKYKVFEDEVVDVNSLLVGNKNKVLARGYSREIIKEGEDLTGGIGTSYTYIPSKKEGTISFFGGVSKEVGEAKFVTPVSQLTDNSEGLLYGTLDEFSNIKQGQGSISEVGTIDLITGKNIKTGYNPLTGEFEDYARIIKPSRTTRSTIVGETFETDKAGTFGFIGGKPSEIRYGTEATTRLSTESGEELNTLNLYPKKVVVKKPNIKGIIITDDVDEVQDLFGTGQRQIKKVPKNVQESVQKQITAQQSDYSSFINKRTSELSQVGSLAQKTSQVITPLLLSGVTQVERQKERQIQKPIQITREGVKERTLILNTITPITKTSEQTRQIPRELQLGSQIAQQTFQRPRRTIPLTPKTPTPREPFRFPQEIIPLEKSKGQREPAYDAYVRRDATKGTKARWEKLNKVPLTQESALGLASREVDSSISARGKIERAKDIVQQVRNKVGQLVNRKVKPKAVDTKDKYYKENQYKFREYATKKKKPLPTGVFIERQKYRQDKPFEKKELKEARNVKRLFGL